MAWGNKKMKIVSSFFGEFGWFLWGFQGHMRYLAQENDVIVISRPEYEFLVKDFVAQFIPFDCGSYETSGYDVKNARSYKHLLTNLSCDRLIDETWHIGYDYNPNGTIRLKPGSVFDKQIFVKYGKFCPDKSYHILIHARSTNKWKTGKERNWPLENWIGLIYNYKSFKIASIGSKDGAFHIPDTIDLRGVELSELADVMASSILTIGSSSGPLHFSSLCNCPHIVWSPEFNRLRYEKYWNFLQTPVIFCGEGWQPSVEKVRSLLTEGLSKWS